MELKTQQIRFYLRPDKSESESVAAEKLSAMPDGWKASFSRNALLAAVALSQISEALPGILAASLHKDVDKAEVTRALLSALELPGLAVLDADAPVQTEEPAPLQETPPKGIAAGNLSGLMPD